MRCAAPAAWMKCKHAGMLGPHVAWYRCAKRVILHFCCAGAAEVRGERLPGADGRPGRPHQVRSSGPPLRHNPHNLWMSSALLSPCAQQGGSERRLCMDGCEVVIALLQALDLPGGEGGAGAAAERGRQGGHLQAPGGAHEGALWGRRHGAAQGLLLPALALRLPLPLQVGRQPSYTTF